MEIGNDSHLSPLASSSPLESLTMVYFLFLRQLEVWMTARLLRSPSFHQMVGKVHERVQHIRHGIPPEPSRTSLKDDQGPNLTKFIDYFKEEIKDQMKGKPPNKL